MNEDDLRSYAERDWQSIERAKKSFWIERKRALPPAEALEIAEGLRRHVRSLRPDWPSAAERMADIEVHASVSASLRLAR